MLRCSTMVESSSSGAAGVCFFDPASNRVTEATRESGLQANGDQEVVGPSRPVPLADGSVLLSGGCCLPGGEAWATAALFEPRTKTLSTLPSASRLNIPRWGHTATLLTDGRVMIASGRLGSPAGRVSPRAWRRKTRSPASSNCCRR